MTLEKACEVLELTKGDIMSLAYGGMSGIDTAIPQGYADDHGYSYGNADTKKNLFWIVADCRDVCNIVDMRDVISDDRKDGIIACAIILNMARTKCVSIESISSAYQSIKEYTFRIGK